MCLLLSFFSLTFHLALASDLQTGKALTAKGMQVLEFVGKETMDLLITETGLGVEKNRVDFKDQVLEEVTFDRCFYIYGGPEQLEVHLSLKITRQFFFYWIIDIVFLNFWMHGDFRNWKHCQATILCCSTGER